MNVNAKQLISVDYHSMDITTALGFFMQIKAKFTPDPSGGGGDDDDTGDVN